MGNEEGWAMRKVGQWGGVGNGEGWAMGRVCDGAGKGGQWGGYVMVRGRVGNGEGM